MKLVNKLTGTVVSGYCSHVLVQGRPVLTSDEFELLGLSMYSSYINSNRDKTIAVVSQATPENPDADLRLFDVGEQYIVVSEDENEVQVCNH